MGSSKKIWSKQTDEVPHGRPVVPLGYVQSKNAQHKRKSINKYTVKGREQIHKNLAIDTATMYG